MIHGISLQMFDEREQWLRARNGLFTSSELIRLMAETDKEDENTLSDGAMSYILETISEVHAEPKMQFYNSSMQWGIDTEPQAVEALLTKLGYKLTDPNIIYTSIGGFVFFKYGDIAGGTPDVILPYACVENKCPDSHTHLYYLLNLTPENFLSKEHKKKLAELKKYYCQMQFNMFLTGKEKCLFTSFDPRFKHKDNQLLIIHIPADKDYQQKILNKIHLASEKRIELINRLAK